MSVIFKALRAIESRDGQGRRDTPEVRVAEGASTPDAVPLVLGIATLALLLAAVIIGFNGIEEQPRARPIVEAAPASDRADPGYDSIIIANSTNPERHGELDDDREHEATGMSRDGAGRRPDGRGNTITETRLAALDGPAATTRMVFQPAADKQRVATLATTGSWQDLRRVNAEMPGPEEPGAASTAAPKQRPGGEQSPPAIPAHRPAETRTTAVRDPEPSAGPANKEAEVVAPDIAAKSSTPVDAIGGPLEDEDTVTTYESSLAAVADADPRPAPTTVKATPGPAGSPRVDSGQADAGFSREGQIGQVSVTRVGDAERMRLLNQRLAAAITHRNEQQISSILVAMVHVVGIDSVFMLKTRAFTQLALDGDAGLAMNLLQQVLARDPTDLDAAINMAVAEIKLGYREQARRRLHNLASAAPHDVRVESLLSSIR